LYRFASVPNTSKERIMGLLISTLRDNFFKALPAKIIMVGLEAAGTQTTSIDPSTKELVDGKAFVILPLSSSV
jgi:hypothetical protein